MSENLVLTQRLDRGWRWISRRSQDVVAGGRTVADESDRWFLGALRGLELGAARAQGGADAIANAIALRLERIRPKWTRRRTPRERIESILRAEGKRVGFDVKRKEFHEFSGKLAVLLELVYSGALPLDDIAFEAADASNDDAGTLGAVPTEGGDGNLTREACDEGGALAAETAPPPTQSVGQ